ncbi:MAG: hypothetical protein ACK4XJ_10575 [Fimbriimonadaceae bacterium]
MKRWLIVAALIALAGLGCQSGPKAENDGVAPVVTNATGSAGSDASPSAPGTNPDTPVAGPEGSEEKPKPRSTPVDDAIARGEFKDDSGRPIESVKPFEVPEPGTQGWKTSGLSAAELGKRLDQAVAELADSEVRGVLTLRDFGGQSGQAALRQELHRDAIYRMEFVDMRKGFDKYIVVSDGKRQARAVNGDWGAPVAAPKPNSKKAEPAAIVRAWEREFPRLVFEARHSGSGSLAALGEGLDKGLDGFTRVVEERTITYNNIPKKFYRIIASKKGKSANESTVYEIVVDGSRFLPVTLKANTTNAEGKAYRAQYQIGYEFGKQQSVSEFNLPPQSTRIST